MLRRTGSSSVIGRASSAVGTPTHPSAAGLLFPCAPAAATIMRCCSTTSTTTGSALSSTTNSPLSTFPLHPPTAVAGSSGSVNFPSGSLASSLPASPLSAHSSSMPSSILEQVAASSSSSSPPPSQQQQRPPSFALCCATIADAEIAAASTDAKSGSNNLHERAAVVARSLNVPDARFVAPAAEDPSDEGTMVMTTRPVAMSHVFLVHVDAEQGTAALFDVNTDRVVHTISSISGLGTSEDERFTLTQTVAMLCDNDMLAVFLPAAQDAAMIRSVGDIAKVLCDCGFNAIVGPSVDEMVDVLLQHEDVEAKALKEADQLRKREMERARMFGDDFAAPASVRDGVDALNKASSASASASAAAAASTVTVSGALRDQRSRICADGGIDFAEIEAKNETASSSSSSSASFLRTSWNYLRFAGANRKIIYKSERSGTRDFVELLHDLVAPTANVLVVDVKTQPVSGQDLTAIQTYNVRTRQRNSALGTAEAAVRLIAGPREDDITIIVPTTRSNREVVHGLAATTARSRRYVAFAYPRDFDSSFGTISTSDPIQFAKTAERIGQAKISSSYSLEDFEREALRIGGARFRSFVRAHKLAKAADDGNLDTEEEHQQPSCASAAEQDEINNSPAPSLSTESFRPSEPANNNNSNTTDDADDMAAADAGSSLTVKNSWESLDAVRAMNTKVKSQLNMIYHNPQRKERMERDAAAMESSFVVMVWKANAVKAYRRASNATAPESYMERLSFLDHSGNHFLPPLCSYGRRGQARVPNLDGYDTLAIHGAKEALLLLAGDAELRRFLKRGGRVWCTAVAEYALTGFRTEFPKVALHDMCLRYGAPTSVTDYSWNVNTSCAMESQLFAVEEATKLGSGGAAAVEQEELVVVDGEQQPATTTTVTQQQQEEGNETTTTTTIDGIFPTTRNDRSRARECAAGLRAVFLKQLSRSLKQAQLTSLLSRMDAAVVHGEIERNGIFVDSKKAQQQSVLSKQELASVNQLLSASVPAELPVDAVQRNMFSWDNWKHVEAFFFGGTIRVGQQRYVETPGNVAQFMTQLAFHTRKLNQLRGTGVVESCARWLRQQQVAATAQQKQEAATSTVVKDITNAGSDYSSQQGAACASAAASRSFNSVKSWLFDLHNMQQQQQQQPVSSKRASSATTSSSKNSSSSSSSSKRSSSVIASTKKNELMQQQQQQNEPYRFILFDLETTGLDGETDRIVEYCFFEPSTGRTLQSLVNPLRKIPVASQKVHKIDDDMVKDAPTFRAQAKKIAHFLGIDTAETASSSPAKSKNNNGGQQQQQQQQQKQKVILMSHSAFSLDQPILLNQLASSGIHVDFSQLLIADSLPLLVAVKDQRKLLSLKLGSLAKHLGVTPNCDGSSIAKKNSGGGGGGGKNNSKALVAAPAASSSPSSLHRADADVKLLWNVLKAALRIKTPKEILPLIVDTFTLGERHCFHGHCAELQSVAQVTLPGVVHSYFPGKSPQAVEKMRELTIASGTVIREFVEQGCNEATLYAQKLKLERNITVFDRDDETLGTVHPDSCIRQEIALASTATGRTASRSPNCQNIPKDDKSRIREVFVSRYGPSNGWMVEVDFKQLEIAVLGLLSQDPGMVRDLADGVDFHLRRCQVMVKRSYEELVALHRNGDKTVKEHRQRAKTVSFQRMYGAGPVAIQKYTKLDMEIVKGMIEQEERSYPGVRSMHQMTRSMCLRQGNPGSTTHFVYELPTGARVSLAASDVSLSLPSVKNYPIQSYGAELVTMALSRLLREFVLQDRFEGKACLVNFVHDSVWLDCHDSVVKEVVSLVQNTMSSLQDQLARDFPGAPNNVKFGVSSSIGRNLWDTMSLQQWEKMRSSSESSVPRGAVSTASSAAQQRATASPSPSASAAAVTRSKPSSAAAVSVARLKSSTAAASNSPAGKSKKQQQQQ